MATPVAALIELLRLTGSRPSELLYLRPCDVDTATQPWTVRPERHKTSYRGRERVIYLGPRAQAVIKPFLDRGLTTYMFSPREAVAERHAQAPTHRRPNQPDNPKKTDRSVQNHYTKDSFAVAIGRGCDAAGGCARSVFMRVW